MALHQDNMQAIAKFGDAHPEGSFHFRISKVDDTQSDAILIYCKCQTEPCVGKQIRERIDRGNQTALEKLKTIYEAVGYRPGPEGHDPEKIDGGEFYSTVKHNVSEGKTYANLVPWTIRSLSEGPYEELGPRQ